MMDAFEEISSQHLMYEDSPMALMGSLNPLASQPVSSFSSQGSQMAAQHVPHFRPRQLTSHRLSGIRGNGVRLTAQGDAGQHAGQPTVNQLIMDCRKLMAQNTDLKELVFSVSKSLSEVPNLLSMMATLTQTTEGIKTSVEAVAKESVVNWKASSASLQDLRKDVNDMGGDVSKTSSILQDIQSELRSLKNNQQLTVEALKAVGLELKELRTTLNNRMGRMEAQTSVEVNLLRDDMKETLKVIQETRGDDQGQLPCNKSSKMTQTSLHLEGDGDVISSQSACAVQWEGELWNSKAMNLTLLSPIAKRRALDDENRSVVSPVVLPPSQSMKSGYSWFRSSTRVPPNLQTTLRTSTPAPLRLPAFIRAREECKNDIDFDEYSSNSDLD